MSLDPTKRVAAVYDCVAERYAAQFKNELEHKPFDHIMLRWLATQVPPGEVLLEIGAGPGEISGFLAKLGVKCLGTDLSPAMVEQAKQLFPEAQFATEDYFSLSFEDESFCAVVAYYAIVNYALTDLERAFREILRILKPEGLFLFTFHEYDGKAEQKFHEFLDTKVDEITVHFFELKDMRQTVEVAGFRVIDIVERQPYFGFEYPSKRAYFVLRKGEPSSA